MQRILLTSVLAVAFTGSALCDGLDKSRVPASARAVVHIDIEALIASQMVRKVQELHPEVQIDVDLGEHHPMLRGLHPLRELRSVTFFTGPQGFASEPENQRVGALVRCSEKIDALLQMATGVEQYQLTPLDGWQVHSWSEGGQTVYGAVLPVGGSNERLVLVSNDSGVAVLQGKGRSLAQGGKGQLSVAPESGAILFAATDQSLSSIGDVDPSSMVARLVQGGVFQLGETQGRVFANLSLTTQEPQDAQRVLSILQGVTAMASLCSEDMEEGQVLQQLASSLRFQSTGNLLYVEFSYDIEQLVRDLQSLEQH
jgi:hypothetical protein